MIKKKSLKVLFILLLLLLVMLLSTCYAIPSNSTEFEEEMLQNVEQIDTGNLDNIGKSNIITGLFKSAVWNQYKQDIDFLNNTSILVRITKRSGTDFHSEGIFRVLIGLWNENNAMEVTNSGWLNTLTTINFKYISFDCSGNAFWEQNLTYTLVASWDTDYGWTANVQNFNVNISNNTWTLFFTNNQITNAYNIKIWGRDYSASVSQPFNSYITVDEDGQTWLGSFFVGKNYEWENITFVTYDSLGNELDYDLRNITSNINGVTGFNIIVGDTIINGERYFIDIKYNEEIIWKAPYGTIVYVRGQEPNPEESGEIIGDLTETNQKLDNIANIIESGNKEIVETITSGDLAIINALESGEKKAEERQTFWEQAYDKMFKPSNEVISGELNSLIEELEFTSGESSGEADLAKIGLDIINNEWGDFIISWAPKKTHFSIAGQQVENQLEIKSENQELGNNQINFSDLERKNEDFQEIMKWVRVITSFVVFSAFAKQVYEVLLITLGINTSVYNMRNREIEKQNREIEKEKATTRRQMFNANQERLREYNKLARQKGWKK